MTTARARQPQITRAWGAGRRAAATSHLRPLNSGRVKPETITSVEAGRLRHSGAPAIPRGHVAGHMRPVGDEGVYAQPCRRDRSPLRARMASIDAKQISAWASGSGGIASSGGNAELARGEHPLGTGRNMGAVGIGGEGLPHGCWCQRAKARAHLHGQAPGSVDGLTLGARPAVCPERGDRAWSSAQKSSTPPAEVAKCTDIAECAAAVSLGRLTLPAARSTVAP